MTQKIQLSAEEAATMGLFDVFRSQFIDIIEWADENPRVLVHRFDRHNNEIKYGAKLIVRPGQSAIFVNEGQIADHFGPGTYTLHTKNLPVLTSLLSLPYNFESPWKAEVYFVRTTVQLDRKWGTGTPVMMRDADFGVVRLRAYGNFSYRVSLQNDLLQRFVGAQADYSGTGIEEQVTAQIVSILSDTLGELKIPALDLAAEYTEISEGVKGRLDAVFSAMGFELCSFTVENISLPEEVNKALDKRSSVGALGGVMNQYTQMQAADAMKAAAENPNGSGMMGAVVGMNLGNTGMGAVNAGAGQAQGAPPPLPAAPAYHAALNGQSAGPFTTEQLRGFIAAGSLKPDTLVWKSGMAGWAAASSVPEIAQLFGSVPPPL